MGVRLMQWSEYIVLFGRSAYGKLGHIRIYLHRLKYVDQCLQLENRDRGKAIGGILVSMVSTLVILTATVIKVYDNITEQDRVLWYMTYLIYTVICTLVSPHFTLLVMELLLRYRELNRQLVLTICPNTGTDGSANDCLTDILLYEPELSQRSRDANINDLRAAYAVLHRAAETLQQHYGPAATSMVAGAFFGVINSSYEIIALLVEDVGINTGVLSHSLLGSSLWLAYHGVKLVAVSMCCAAACDEERRTGVLLHRAATAFALCGTPLPEAEAFLHEVRRGPPLSFTAGGFFHIRRSLVISTLATVITHIVILTQFGIEP
ncbi:putative gustatory receptor 2a [Schistocerca serialis cubense]|uniref:putative gustatory receptor 2a n=1 Tax=Schistocerca serialis cubense TaxID=2023355 RepID=UPI00214E12CF|nr:putative gustatory receptor 2a [Schistocerca serialis cubense]